MELYFVKLRGTGTFLLMIRNYDIEEKKIFNLFCAIC